MSKIKECWNCFKYKAFYTKGLCRFDKCKMGYCKRHNKIIDDKHQSCELWENNYRMFNTRKSIARKKLDEVLDCILQIKQILAEEQEEINTND